MAKCKDCGASFGCGCQLINGRCSACNYAYLESIKQPSSSNNQVTNANSQTNKLR